MYRMCCADETDVQFNTLPTGSAT
eukprot:COSAG06_NODE_58334_length_277_cov_0.859551_2_plen_23_part_01